MVTIQQRFLNMCTLHEQHINGLNTKFFHSVANTTLSLSCYYYCLLGKEMILMDDHTNTSVLYAP